MVCCRLGVIEIFDEFLVLCSNALDGSIPESPYRSGLRCDGIRTGEWEAKRRCVVLVGGLSIFHLKFWVWICYVLLAL